MTESEKALAGELYDANHDHELIQARLRAKEALRRYNHTDPADIDGRTRQLKALLGRTGRTLWIEPPFHCDYGRNLEVGENFYANYHLVVLDAHKVLIGDNVFIGPNVGLHTAGHPLDVEQRNAGLEYARPISIGHDVWIGAGVQVLPGVSIGDGSVIGAGSVVNRDVPAGVIAAGVPCRVVRSIVGDGPGPAAGAPAELDPRLTEVEIKLSYTEDLLEELNLVIYRQQQQIDTLIRQVTALRQQSPESGGPARNPQDELPPHY